MRKLIFGATVLVAVLAVRAAAAGGPISPPALGVLAGLLGIALVCLVAALPAILISAVLRACFTHQKPEFEEVSAELFILPSAIQARPPEGAAKR